MPADERIWTVGPDETGEVDAELLAQELIGLVSILLRLGGGVSIIARRRQEDDGLYVTERVDMGWRLHAPLPRRSKPQPVPDVPFEDDEETAEPEIEPAAVSG